jgi:hypothetical protein
MAAPDFYFAINATFRWLQDTFGHEALTEYWQAMGRDHFADITKRFAEGGLPAVRDYWQAFFDEEPGGDVSVDLIDDEVIIEVRTCPALKHLREHNREIMPRYCEHCTVVSQAMCKGAGITVKIEGGGGSCRQVFAEGGTK